MTMKTTTTTTVKAVFEALDSQGYQPDRNVCLAVAGAVCGAGRGGAHP